MAIAINREIAGDLNKPDSKLLAYCVGEHQKTLSRLDKLSDYYDGKHDIFKRTKKNSAAPNNKVLINHAKYVVDMNTGFMVGNPISYSQEESKNIKPILEAYDRVDIVSHDTEMEKDLSTFGIAYELIYLTTDEYGSTVIDIECIDPRGILLVTDDTVEKNKLFAIHYQPVLNLEGAISHYLLKYYNDSWVITYKSTGEAMTDFELIKAQPHYFGSVPVNEYRNNEEKQGDFEQAISLIDAYNLLQYFNK
jgi:SPP1 family phage portal protein